MFRCWTIPFSPLSLVSLWWRGDFLVLYFFPSGGGCCTLLCLSVCQAYTKHTHACTVSKSRVSVTAWEMWHIYGLCWSVYIAVHMPVTWSLLSLFFICEGMFWTKFSHSVGQVWNSCKCNTWLEPVSVCVYQDWSIDLNRTLSRREKKKPSEGVTLTGISQTGSDQPVQPAKTSSR